MDNLLHFTKKKLKATQPDVNHKMMYLGSWEFTCPHCAKSNIFQCDGMIFRVVDFYCSSCGTLHRVINPAFSK